MNRMYVSVHGATADDVIGKQGLPTETNSRRVIWIDIKGEQSAVTVYFETFSDIVEFAEKMITEAMRLSAETGDDV